MDPTEMESGFVVDLECGNSTNLEEMATDPSGAMAAGEFVIFENGATLVANILNVVTKEVDDEKTTDSLDKSRKDRRKAMSAKKPPRPPKALSLDAADQKLIRELAELALMKRARIERMKATKKMKASKASASTGNLLAMIFTTIFCLVIIFQGVCPGRSSAVRFQASPESAETTNSQFISLRYRRNTTTHDATDARLVVQASGLPIGNKASGSSQ